jgi:ferredoxin
MDGWRLSDEQLRDWLASLLEAGRKVVAPVEEDGLVLFREVASAAEMRLEPRGRTRWSAKEFLFPATETLFSFSFDGDSVAVEMPPKAPEQVIVGLRPCDAAGIARLDEVLLADELYARRREGTTLVSIACAEADPACFCTAVGGSPAGTEGSDLQFVPLDGDWVGRSLSERGTALVGRAASLWAPAREEDWAAVDAQRRTVEESIGADEIPAEWAGDLAEQFDAELWTTVGDRCLRCGLCAYVCPTCSCFDVNDAGNAQCGTRCRSWDSCGFAQFTKQAAGHNPRPTQPARYRQRVLHKFAWFVLEHGQFMCVGCGRCVELCPAGLDIREAVKKVANP